MRQLTQLELKDLFCTTDDVEIRTLVNFWNLIHPGDQIESTTRRATGQIEIYRENLPERMESVLAEREAGGRVYVAINEIERVAA